MSPNDRYGVMPRTSPGKQGAEGLNTHQKLASVTCQTQSTHLSWLITKALAAQCVGMLEQLLMELQPVDDK